MISSRESIHTDGIRRNTCPESEVRQLESDYKDIKKQIKEFKNMHKEDLNRVYILNILNGKLEKKLEIAIEAESEELRSEYKKIDNINTDLRIELQKVKQQIKDMKYEEEFH